MDLLPRPVTLNAANPRIVCQVFDGTPGGRGRAGIDHRHYNCLSYDARVIKGSFRPWRYIDLLFPINLIISTDSRDVI